MISGAPQPKHEGLLKHAFIAFGLAVAVYIGFFSCDRHLRAGRGPWRVDFLRTNDLPALLVNQPHLGISNVLLVMERELPPGQTGTVIFDAVRKTPPFGSVKFEDLTYLPGSITFDFNGHEVEILPRTLIANKREIPWQSGAIITLTPTQKVGAPMAPHKR